MIEVWYDVYDGSEKKEETQNKAEALATVLNKDVDISFTTTAG